MANEDCERQRHYNSRLLEYDIANGMIARMECNDCGKKYIRSMNDSELRMYRNEIKRLVSLTSLQLSYNL